MEISMKKIINATVIFELLLFMSACKPNSNKVSYAAQQERIEISNKIKSLISDLELLEEKASNLREFPDIPNRCIEFSIELVDLAKKVMSKGRNQKINSLLLDMADRNVEVARKIRNSLLQTDSFMASVFWQRVVAKCLIVRDFDQINSQILEGLHDVDKFVENLNFFQGPFGFYDANSHDELYYDMMLENDQMLEKLHEKLKQIADPKSYGSRFQRFFEQIEMRLKNYRENSLETQIYRLFKIRKISEDVIKEKWLPILKTLEGYDPNKSEYFGSLFSKSLINIAGKIMVKNRDPEINSLILNMSSRTMEVMDKAKNAWLKANPGKVWDTARDFRTFFWVNVSDNDKWLRRWNILNSVAYDDKCDSLEAVKKEIGEIIDLTDEKDFQYREYWGLPNINWDMYYKIPQLIEDFYKKLKKIGCYDVKHDEKTQKFFDFIKKYAADIDKEKKDDAVLIPIRDLFRTTDISDDTIVKELNPIMKFLEDSEPEKVAYVCYEFSKELNRFAQEVMAEGRNPRINSLILEISTRLMKIKAKDSNEENHNFLWLNAGVYDINIRFWDVMNKIVYDDKCDSLEAVEKELSKISQSYWDNSQVKEHYRDNNGSLSGCELPEEINPLIIKFHEKLEKVGSYKVKRGADEQDFFKRVKKRAQKIKDQ